MISWVYRVEMWNDNDDSWRRIDEEIVEKLGGLGRCCWTRTKWPREWLNDFIGTEREAIKLRLLAVEEIQFQVEFFPLFLQIGWSFIISSSSPAVAKWLINILLPRDVFSYSVLRISVIFMEQRPISLYNNSVPLINSRVFLKWPCMCNHRHSYAKCKLFVHYGGQNVPPAVSVNRCPEWIVSVLAWNSRAESLHGHNMPILR